LTHPEHVDLTTLVLVRVLTWTLLCFRLTITNVPVSQAGELLGVLYQIYGEWDRDDSHRAKLSNEATVMVNPMSDELVKALSRRGDPIVPHYFLRRPPKTDIYVPTTGAAGQNAPGTLGLLNDYPG
jgi:hypothetical protein